MKKTTKVIVGAVALAGVATIPAVASAGSGGAEGADVPITGEALEKASAAALAHLGEGRVTETEVGDEESLYEVEVTLADGSQVDVQLDDQFRVVGTEVDGADDSD